MDDILSQAVRFAAVEDCMGCCCPPPGLVRRLAERLAAANQRIAELERLGEWVGQPELERINVGQLRERVAESERQIAKLEGLLGCGHVALNLVVKWATMLREQSDNGQDAKVRKGLRALAGELRGYAPDTDGIHAFIREIAEYRRTSSGEKPQE